MTGYSYDPDRLARTAALLYAHLPTHLKAQDAKNAAAVPPSDEELRTFVDILAAPLAALRQSIEELQGDFFVDTAGNEMLPLLAETIGLQLVFSDAEANRRDLAGTVARRRRKGTPAMLEEMARTLADRLVATNEGWKLVQITQDLNILRLERTALDLRAPSVAEKLNGPLASLAKSVDPRAITANSGRVHPRHMAHWLHLSQYFPLSGASAHRLPDGDADLRFAFDAENAWRPLRCRPTGVEDTLRTDRVPERIFSEDPGAWFEQDGRFSVRIANLPAAASAQDAPRTARNIPASDGILTTNPSIDVIDYDGARTSGPVAVSVMAVPVVAGLPDTTAAVLRAGIVMDITGQIGTLPPAGAIPADAVPMLRLSTTGGAASRVFAGAVLRITGGLIRARHPSPVGELAQEGYRNGALYVSVPAVRLTDQRWFYIGADGGLHHADTGAGAGVTVPLSGSNLPDRALTSPPVGPIWPPAPTTADRRPFAAPLAAPGAAPLVVHGAQALHPSGNSVLPGGETSALSFALGFAALGRQFRPMLRLVWSGADPAAGTWEALDETGAPAPDVAARWTELAETVAAAPADLSICLRFESERANARLMPGEIAFTGQDGRAVLIHTPELIASEIGGPWPIGPAPLAAQSAAVQVGRDGSTWTAGTNLLRRRALGSAVPLPGPIAPQRRVLRWRVLCAWQNESPPDVLDPALPGMLDIDPAHGLFAMAASEPPPDHPAGPVPQPDSVSVAMQTGSTMSVGALPLDHDRVLGRAPEPATRLVSASGHLSKGAVAVAAGQTLHRTLAEALTAIASDPQPREVIEIADSRFYPGEVLTWPAGPDDIVIRAARDTQPIVSVANSVPGGVSYRSLELTGIALTSAVALTLNLPQAQSQMLNFVTVRRSDLTLAFSFFEDTGAEALAITRAVLGPITLADPGLIRIADGVLDAGAGGLTDAIVAPEADLTMDRVTLLGPVQARQVDISDSILRHPVTAGERFAGCIRYSALAPGGQTPRKHRVVRQPFPRFVTFDRRDPAHLRLAQDTDSTILTGASDGGEMGAFNLAGLPELERAVFQRLSEHTPAGLRTGLIRQN